MVYGTCLESRSPERGTRVRIPPPPPVMPAARGAGQKLFTRDWLVGVRFLSLYTFREHEFKPEQDNPVGCTVLQPGTSAGPMLGNEGGP